MTMGTTGTKTHFAYPNSNVTPLGAVSSSISKSAIFLPPQINEADIKQLMDQAFSQKAGADLVINYKLDTTVTMIPLVFINFYKLEMKLDGTAAKMEVGIKELQALKKDSLY